MTSCATRPAWTPLNIGLMILGFVLFWPLGLAMLAYILWGDRMHEHFDKARQKARGQAEKFKSGPFAPVGKTGNVAFDEYRERELKRLDEERRRLDEERAEFETFVQQLRQAKDREEFERFKSDRSAAKDAPNADGEPEGAPA